MAVAILEQPSDRADNAPGGLLLVTRVPLPEWVREPHLSYRHDDQAASCQRREWGWALPWMYRTLADPPGRHPMPAMPNRLDTLAQLGYWTALAHLLVYSFGWLDLSRGLSRWMARSSRDHSVPSQLLATVWEADGELGRFLEWTDALSESLRLGHARSSTYDPYLIGAHIAGPQRLAAGRKLPRRGQVLFLDGMAGWHAALNRRSGDTPVDVLVKSVGWLGRYSKSPATGLWHSVADEDHLLGQPIPTIAP